MTNSPFKRRSFLRSVALVLGAGSFSARAGASEGPFEVRRSPEEWRRLLGTKRYAVMRLEKTERAGSSPLDRENRRGTFVCAGCALPLFSSEKKFDSGTGWPSFYAHLHGAVGTKTDSTLFFKRTEVHCRRCGGHLGHVFDDGPKPTGKRYCMNGLALTFRAS